MLTIRASSTPLIMRCAGSVNPEPGEILVDQCGDAADLGTEAHRAAAIMVETGRLPWDTLPEDPELRMLCAMVTKLWRQVQDSFPNARTEVARKALIDVDGQEVLITGHSDIESIGGSVARVADWKTGRNDSDYSAQLKTYAALDLYEVPELTEATATILWVRDQEAENYTMAQDEALPWLTKLAKAAIRWNGVYTVGSHCQWCQRTASCPAARAMVRRNVEAFIPGNVADQLAAMTPDQVISLLETAKTVERYAKAAQQVVRDLVFATGEVVGTDHRLTLEQTEKRKAKAIEALSVLQSGWLSDSAIASIMEVHLSQAEKLVANAAGRGNGASAVRRFREQLEAANAVEKKTSYRLVSKRV